VTATAQIARTAAALAATPDSCGWDPRASGSGEPRLHQPLSSRNSISRFRFDSQPRCTQHSPSGRDVARL